MFTNRILWFTKSELASVIIPPMQNGNVMNISIAQKLKELRMSRRLRQDQVAEMIGVTKSTMSAYENGTRQPSYDVLICLARLYHVSTDYLLGLTTARNIDLSGLSEKARNMIADLVDLLSEK